MTVKFITLNYKGLKVQCVTENENKVQNVKQRSFSEQIIQLKYAELLSG